MTYSTALTANQLFIDIVDTLHLVRTTEGIPEATRLRCDQSIDAIHDSMHGLALWLRELLEWAPLSPETRGNVARLARELTEADSGFHAPRALQEVPA